MSAQGRPKRESAPAGGSEATKVRAWGDHTTIDDNSASREAVLARVRAALGRRGSDHEARKAALAYLDARRRGPQPARPTDLVQRFLGRAADMSSTTDRVAVLADVPAAVAGYLASIGETASAGVCWPEIASLDWRASGITIEARPTLGRDALGITACFCAIAETGTLVFVTGAQTPSATFLLPETHVAIVRGDQIVATMEDAFARVRARCGRLPRAVNLVSGPSRTGDIEQTIVLGAHGPRRVHIVLVE
ncbi:MAG TPA: lactate utilization protein C [Casimicrobiaceae bacterium]|nr:lactate utilization protein C [Casimicrobiaceae bacterium]